MNRQVKVKWRMLRTIVHSNMVHARVSGAYINFALMYTIDHIFPVLSIKNMINEDGQPTTPFKLEKGTKPSVSYSRVFYIVHVLYRKLLHILTKKEINMRHQAQKCFRGIFVGIPQHQKRYLVYVPSTRKIISTYYVVFDENKSITLAYT